MTTQVHRTVSILQVVSYVDLDERLHQSGPSDLPAEEASSSITPPTIKSYNANAYRHLRKLTAIGNT